MSAHARWSLGTLIGLPIGLICCLVGVALAVWGWTYWRRTGDSDWMTRWFCFTAGCAVFVIAAALTALGMYPYHSEYHKWQPVSGKVTQVSNRLLGDGNGGVNQRFVAELDGIGERSCDDTRCSLVKVGDILSLKCKRAWQFSGEDGWDCNFVSRRAA